MHFVLLLFWINFQDIYFICKFSRAVDIEYFNIKCRIWQGFLSKEPTSVIVLTRWDCYVIFFYSQGSFVFENLVDSSRNYVFESELSMPFSKRKSLKLIRDSVTEQEEGKPKIKGNSKFIVKMLASEKNVYYEVIDCFKS